MVNELVKENWHKHTLNINLFKTKKVLFGNRWIFFCEMNGSQHENKIKCLNSFSKKIKNSIHGCNARGLTRHEWKITDLSHNGADIFFVAHKLSLILTMLIVLCVFSSSPPLLSSSIINHQKFKFYQKHSEEINCNHSIIDYIECRAEQILGYEKYSRINCKEKVVKSLCLLYLEMDLCNWLFKNRVQIYPNNFYSQFAIYPFKKINWKHKNY